MLSTSSGSLCLLFAVQDVMYFVKFKKGYERNSDIVLHALSLQGVIEELTLVGKSG